MDFLKRQFADQKIDIDLQLQLLSITVLPPPHQSVNIFLKIVRDDKVYHQSRKYKIDPNANSTQKAKISFQESELMQSSNKYYATKSGSREKWEAKDIIIYVMSESGTANVQNIGQQKINLSNYVGQYYQQQKTSFMDTVSFPNGGLVGDFEFEVKITPPPPKRDKSLTSKTPLDASSKPQI